MDRGWMNKLRTSTEYIQGVNEFVQFAFSSSSVQDKILCPCKKCRNCSWGDSNTIYEHLICEGFVNVYKLWNFHGELSQSSAHHNTNQTSRVVERAGDNDDIPELLRDMGFGIGDMRDVDDNEDGGLEEVQNDLVIGRDSLRSRAPSAVAENDGGVPDEQAGNQVVQNAETENPKGQKEKRRGRNFTRKEALWARANEKMPLIKLEWNEFDQPIGKGAKEFPHVVTSLIRTKQFPLDQSDWRDIPIVYKEYLVERFGCVYDMDERLVDYTYATAAKKWKDFKADLKKAKFKEELSREELLKLWDTRVHPNHWEWLVDHWLSDEAKERSARNKINRSKVVTPHTTGSKTIARASHDCSIELGRKLRRDEVYVSAHTPKNGSAPKEATQRRFDDIRTATTLHPELIDSPIEKGDLFSNVFGRDPRGYVRGLGFGTTPTIVGMDGCRKCKSTKVQRAFYCRDKYQEEVSGLKDIVEHLVEEIAELKHVRNGTREDTPQAADDVTPEHGSNHCRSRPTPPSTI